MSKLTWDGTGERLYETGIDHVVLYKAVTNDSEQLTGLGADIEVGPYGQGVAWNGVSKINESPDGADPNAIYADNIKYVELVGTEDFKATIEAYTCPDEFFECDGTAALVEGAYIGQQKRVGFGLSYRTLIGNDTEYEEHGYKLHLVYGCKAATADRDYETVNDSPDAMTLSWEISTTPVEIPIAGRRPTAHIWFDSTKLAPAKLTAIENILYGTDSTPARLPQPSELVKILTAA